MARISYVEIEERLGDHLDAQIDGAKILVEQEVIIANEDQPVVAIYFERRELAPNQYIKRRVDYHLVYTLLCWTFSLEGPLAAARARDNLVAEVEEVLLGDRTGWAPAGAVETSWIEGGEMPTGRIERARGFASVGEIRLIVVVNATSTEG